MPKPCNKRPAVVLQHMPWSPRPFKVEYFDSLGNKYIEQFTAYEVIAISQPSSKEIP